jgi:hypothetical protein
VVRQRAPVDEHAAQLVHPALTCNHSNALERRPLWKNDFSARKR